MNIFIKLICFLLLVIQSDNTTVPPDVQYRLSGKVIPTHYDIHLILDPDVFQTFMFTGVEEIECYVIENDLTYTIELHSKKLHIVAVELKRGNKTIPVTTARYYSNRQNDFLIIRSAIPLYGRGYILSIGFYGYFNTEGMHGFYLDTYEENGEKKYFAATQLQPTHAREFFPCFDEPKYKAYFNLTISHPTKYKVISNTLPYSTSRPVTNQDIITEKFTRTPRMSTYLLAVVVSEFTCNKGFGALSSIRFDVCSRNQTTNIRDTPLELTSTILQKLEDITGIRYGESGIGKLTEVAVPNSGIGAMENWGLLIFRESSFLLNKSESSNRELQVQLTLLAHELVHQWFGNLVTMEWWSYTFLNEGFAQYFEYHIMDEIYPEWELQKQFTTDVLQSILPDDSEIYIPELSSPVSTPEEISYKFGFLSYKKAASIFRMVAHFMTVEEFLKGVKYYINEYKYKNTNPIHLWDSLRIYTTLPGNMTFEEVIFNWMSKAGFPLLTVKLHDRNISISQERFLTGSGKDGTKWYVPISYTLSTDKEKFINTTARVWLTPDKDLNITNALGNADWIILNNQQTGYYRVNYDDALWHKISTALNQQNFSGIDAISRSQIVDDLLNLAKVKKIKYTKVFDIISFLKNDTEYYPWFSAMNGISYISKKIVQNSIERPFQNHILKLIENFYKSVLFDKRDNHVYGLKQELAIKYACRFNHFDCIANAKQLFVTYRKKLIRPNANIRQTIYCTALRHSGNINNDWNFLWKQLKKTKNPTEYAILLNSLGCTENKAKLNSYLTEIITPNSTIRIQDASTAFKSVTTKGYVAVNAAFDIITKNFTQIRYYLGSENLKDFIRAAAYQFTTQEQIDRLNNFINNTNVETFIKLSAETSLHTAQDNLQWTKKFENKMKNYFSSATLATFNIFLLTIFVLFIRIY